MKENRELSDSRESNQSEERIGDYRIHPVAAMFPLLKGDDYEDLRSSIEANGQLKPIVVQGDVLLDGCNRLQACLEIGLSPKVVQYSSELDVATYIRCANIDRRHLSEDQRVGICGQIYRWDLEQRNTAKKTAPGQHGAEGGRGHKKTLTPKSEQAFPVSDRNTRSTAVQIASQAKVSRYKGAQAIAVEKARPDLVELVQQGKIKLREAFAQIRAAGPKQMAKPRKPPRFDIEKKEINRGSHIRRSPLSTSESCGPDSRRSADASRRMAEPERSLSATSCPWGWCWRKACTPF
jgi:ParB-like chromosome segregation protein Spo0J